MRQGPHQVAEKSTMTCIEVVFDVCDIHRHPHKSAHTHSLISCFLMHSSPVFFAVDGDDFSLSHLHGSVTRTARRRNLLTSLIMETTC